MKINSVDLLLVTAISSVAVVINVLTNTYYATGAGMYLCYMVGRRTIEQ